MNLVKSIRSAIDSGNIILGTRETLKEVMQGNVKYVVVASNCEREAKEDLMRYSAISGLEVHVFEGSSVELGEVCGKPFVVSMLTILEGQKKETGATGKK